MCNTVIVKVIIIQTWTIWIIQIKRSKTGWQLCSYNNQDRTVPSKHGGIKSPVFIGHHKVPKFHLQVLWQFYSNVNWYSNNINMFIVYWNKYASNSFKVEFCFRYKYRRIQRKMCACKKVRITKSSFSKVLLIKTVEVSTGDSHVDVATQLYWNSYSACWCPLNLLQHYIIKNLLKAPRRRCFRTTFFAWLSIKNVSSFYLINHIYIKDMLICYVCGLI